MADNKTFSLKPLTTCIALFNVSRENRVCIWSSGPLSAREYDHLIRMIEMDRETMREEEARDVAELHASVDTRPKDEDSTQIEAPAPLSGAVPAKQGDAPNSPPSSPENPT